VYISYILEFFSGFKTGKWSSESTKSNRRCEGI